MPTLTDHVRVIKDGGKVGRRLVNFQYVLIELLLAYS
jgi:hypothetical protein